MKHVIDPYFDGLVFSDAGEIISRQVFGSHVAIDQSLSGVIAGTYGDSVTVPQLILDSKGRIIAAANIAIAFPASAETSPLKAKTSATSGDPGARYLLWNNATQSSATELNISDINDNLNDISIFIALFASGDHLVIADRTDSTKSQKWLISSAPVDHTTYWTIPVSLVSSTYSFANNDPVFLIWIHESGGGGVPGGANTQVQFNDSGAFGGDAGLTYNKATDTLIIGTALNIAGTANQIILQSAGVTGTITWTPTTSNKIITLPDLTGTVALGAGTSTVSSTNSVTVASHTHAITSSANPGAAASILATDSAGNLIIGGEFRVTNAAPTISLLDTSVSGRLVDILLDAGLLQFRDATSIAIDILHLDTANALVLAKGTTDSTSTTTGALQSAGGLGVAKAIFSGDKITANKNSSALPATTDATLHLGQADGTGNRLAMDVAASNCNITWRRVNNTIASPSALAANDAIGQLVGIGYGATGYASSARASVVFFASQAWTDANQGTYVSIATTPNNSTTQATAVTVGQDKSLTVVGGFGCNTKAAQTAFASGGAAPAGGTGATAGAYDTAAHRDALITLVNNIRTALVNNGIMS